MDHEPSFDNSPGALELRVLAGPQAGARAAIDAGQVRTLAAGADGDGADIVLREERDTPVRVRLVADRGMAMIEVIDGPVMLGEQEVPTGESKPWPMHAPLKIGSSVVAFGPAGDEAWPGDAAATPASTGSSEAGAAESLLRPPKRARSRWLLGVGLLGAAAVIAVLGFTLILSGEPGEAPRTPFEAALRKSEFASLTVAQDTAGRPELRGRLATLEQRMKLDAWLAAQGVSPVVSVFVDEAAVRDVTEVFRVNGIAVRARVPSAGQVVADAAERDEEQLARAAEVVRRDVRGVQKLVVANKPPPAAPPPPPPVVDDPGKRIASVVPGNPAYIVTADGARYFVGAMLPSGHRITAIDGQHVSVERNGETVTLNL